MDERVDPQLATYVRSQSSRTFRLLLVGDHGSSRTSRHERERQRERARERERERAIRALANAYTDAGREVASKRYDTIIQRHRRLRDCKQVRNWFRAREEEKTNDDDDDDDDDDTQRERERTRARARLGKVGRLGGVVEATRRGTTEHEETRLDTIGDEPRRRGTTRRFGSVRPARRRPLEEERRRQRDAARRTHSLRFRISPVSRSEGIAVVGGAHATALC